MADLRKIFENEKVANAIAMAIEEGELSVDDFSSEIKKQPKGEMSIFLAVIQRMNGIQRWNKSQSIKAEYLHEHSFVVGVICYFLGLHRERIHGKSDNFSPEKLAILGLFHDIGESLVEDTNSLIKHRDTEINALVKEVESKILTKLSVTVDEEIRDRLEEYIVQSSQDQVYKDLVKAADEISAYIKTVQELRSNNGDFLRANKSIGQKISTYFEKYPEVKFLFERYTPAFSLTIDELADLLPMKN
ncbi:5'-deoxynucleotidase [Photobacterium damselae]|uniref:5'-deoxynucleotidase n=1 Tax=Photobacterium damselae TaxID=38293 RepID=UPI001EED5FFC|nr:5'-deoxynucleotidase [Photobacterium damselae]UKA04562.1 5'-deoxynucleotidase [Photobacterium damselae subsp. damselae]